MVAGVPPGLWSVHARLGRRVGDLHGRVGPGQRGPRPPSRPRRQPLVTLCEIGVPDRPGHRAESLVDRSDARAVRRSGRPDGAGRRRGHAGSVAAVGRGARGADGAHGRDPAGGGPGGHHGRRSEPASHGRPVWDEHLGRRRRGGPEHFCPASAVGHPAHALADLSGQSPGRRRGLARFTPAVPGERRTRGRGDAGTRGLPLRVPESRLRIHASRQTWHPRRTGLPGRGDRRFCLLPDGDRLVSHVGTDPRRYDLHLRADPGGGPVGHRFGRRGL